jgi:long-chain fatty acid transport protein
MRKLVFSMFCLSFLATNQVFANGLLRDGATARSLALGGINSASFSGPVDALTGNPAGLGLLPSMLQANAGIAVIDGEFINDSNPRGADAARGPFLIPDLAASYRSGRFAFGAGISPVGILNADWKFSDAPGGLGGVSYGQQQHQLKFTAIRGTIGAAFELNPRLIAGTSIGVIYNQNRLQAPYVFQSQPTLQGAKTLLDLKTDGFGWNASLGLIAKPIPELVLGLHYTTKTIIKSTGRARGDAGLQLGLPGQGSFRYDAEVKTQLPQVASLGFNWRARHDLSVHGQIDWIGWSGSHQQLPVVLTKGNNAIINALVGSNKMDDIYPLDWRDRFVFRTGVEYSLTDRTDIRAGYKYGASPVPTATLTPLLATIQEHSIGFGIGHRLNRYQIDFGYQWALPKRRDIRDSKLLSGEFDNSRLELGIHWLSLSIGYRL